MSTILLTFMTVTSMICLAQQAVNWQFSTKKTEDKKYEVVMTATIHVPWHIYSQHKSDDGPVATSIIFNKNPLVELNNAVKETLRK